jgi:VIT1/CCC1 family predicted Fe2+/Mn2+ transporter
VQVAHELSEHAALGAHAHVFLNLDADEHVSPWAAAQASLIAFLAGSVIPLVVIVFTPLDIRLPLTVTAVLAALVVTGVVSAHLGGAAPLRAVIRNVAVGALAMGLTYLVGYFVGQQL